MDRFSVDCTRYMLDETDIKLRTSSGENLRRQPRHPKLHHSRSDDNRRRSFDRHPKDSQSSRHSLNTQAVVEGSGSDFEQKYFTTVSLDTEESRGDNSDESHVVEVENASPSGLSLEGPTETDMLREEPELENVTEIEVESSGDDIDDNETKSISERNEAAMENQNSTVAEMDSQITLREKNDIKINSEKCEITLHIEGDEV